MLRNCKYKEQDRNKFITKMDPLPSIGKIETSEIDEEDVKRINEAKKEASM